jgi:threonine dehydratase
MSTTLRPAESLVRLVDIEAAREVLRGVARLTPVEGSRPLSDRVGGPVYLKCENLQRTGSFKIRGAYVRISRLPAEQRARGVVAASAGNHAQGLALAASLLDTKSTVFMPEGAPIPKIEATRAYGAEVILGGASLDEALVTARAWADEHGATFVHPFDHPDLLAGQGTAGLEIAEQVPDVRTVVVPAGGGGLLSGIAAAVKGRLPHVRVVGAQAEGAAAFPPSLAAGHPVALDAMATIADGIAVGCPSAMTYAHVSQLVDEVVTVSDEDMSRALVLCLERAKLVVEPAGAAAVAAVMERPADFEPPVVVVLSGGNIDPLLLLRVMRHGLVAAGRFLAFRARISDRPGGLVGLLSELAASGASVLEVAHARTGPKLHLDEVEVAVQIETRGPDHCEEVVDRLRRAGYPLEFT